MPALNLFDINPDKLFETSTIEEIQSCQINLQHEIERKREDLRTMVGEKYRDLIEAADKITEMKAISQNVIKDIEGVSSAMDLLLTNHTRSILNNKKEHIQGANCLTITSEESDVIQLKLLVELPERIWTALDQDDFATSTRLYMLARHIKTGLEMQSIIKDNNLSYKTYSIFIEHQWNSVAQFKKHILERVDTALQEHMIDYQVLSGCFISMALLENKSTSYLLDYFFKARISALTNIFLSTDDVSIIRTRFINSHTIVISTLMVLYSLFIESNGKNGEGVNYMNIYKIIGKNSDPVMKIILDNDNNENFDYRNLYNLLPPIVTNYRCCPDCSLEPLLPEDMSSLVSNFIFNATDVIKISGKLLLENLSSLRSLQGLRNANQELPEEWASVLKLFIQPASLNIWNDHYVPLIVERAKDLITVHWKASLKYLKEQISTIIKDITVLSDDGKTPENNLHWHVWKENQQDFNFTINHQNNEIDHNLSQQQVTRGIWMKSQGITPRVSELCNLFESQLSILLNDLSSLYPSDDDIPSIAEANENNEILLSHQSNQCLEMLSQLMEFIKQDIDKSNDEIVSIYFARFLQSIKILCPTLQKCLTASVTNINGWQEACNLLTSNANYCWTDWKNRFLVTLNEAITSTLIQPKQLKDCLNLIPQWDVVNIEEIGEAGQLLSSDLNIPSSPSFQLIFLLLSVCTSVSNALVPMYVTEMLVNELVVKIIEIYQTWMELLSDQCLIVSSKLWQILFDIKYITAFLVQHDSKSILSKCQQVIGLIESKIDPFDLDVFTPYINNNIKRSHRQTQTLLGAIIMSRISSSLSVNNSTGSSQTKSEDPCVIAISSTASSTWFPLLPITAPPGTRMINPVKSKLLKASKNLEQITLSSNQQSTPPSSKAPQTNTATSFFGSMTSDWFG